MITSRDKGVCRDFYILSFWSKITLDSRKKIPWDFSRKKIFSSCDLLTYSPSTVLVLLSALKGRQCPASAFPAAPGSIGLEVMTVFVQPFSQTPGSATVLTALLRGPIQTACRRSPVSQRDCVQWVPCLVGGCAGSLPSPSTHRIMCASR